MVSCDTRIASSSGKRLLSQPEICCGDQSSLSFLATTSRRESFWASRHLFGRRALSQVRSSASKARYLTHPPLRPTSRLTLEAARPKRAAMAPNESPAASPLEISSRSAWLSARLDLRLWGGANPPVALSAQWIEPVRFWSARPISVRDSPAFHRSQSSFFCNEDSP